MEEKVEKEEEVEEQEDSDLPIFSCRSLVGFCRDLEAELRCEKSSWASMVSSCSWSCRHWMVRFIP